MGQMCHQECLRHERNLAKVLPPAPTMLMPLPADAAHLPPRQNSYYLGWSQGFGLRRTAIDFHL